MTRRNFTKLLAVLPFVGLFSRKKRSYAIERDLSNDCQWVYVEAER